MDLKQFNDLGLNLEILAEEAAEVIQVKSKIRRFGMSCDRKGMYKTTKREWLEEEIGHFLAMVDILIANGNITKAGIDKGKYEKIAKLPKYYKGE